MGTRRLKTLAFLNEAVGGQSCCPVVEPSPALDHTLTHEVGDGRRNGIRKIIVFLPLICNGNPQLLGTLRGIGTPSRKSVTRPVCECARSFTIIPHFHR